MEASDGSCGMNFDARARERAAPWINGLLKRHIGAVMEGQIQRSCEIPGLYVHPWKLLGPVILQYRSSSPEFDEHGKVECGHGRIASK